jgi:hypothetical protein
MSQRVHNSTVYVGYDEGHSMPEVTVCAARDGWHGSVTLDGVDVSSRCTEVHFVAERPIAVVLVRLEFWRGAVRRFETRPYEYVPSDRITARLRLFRDAHQA